MNNLNDITRGWRQSMSTETSITPHQLDELEVHLQDTIEVLVERGLSLEEAAQIGIQRIGQPVQLQHAFAKNQSFWSRFFRRPVLLSFAAATSLVFIFSTIVWMTISYFEFIPSDTSLLFARPGTTLRLELDGVYVSGGLGGMVSFNGLWLFISLVSITAALGVYGWFTLLKQNFRSA